MVNLGNSWDEILKDEFEKEYYQKIRKFLIYEYNHYKIFPNMNDIFNALKLSDYNVNTNSRTFQYTSLLPWNLLLHPLLQ